MSCRCLGALMAGVFAVSRVSAQSPEAPACAASATYALLDFWIGDWEVYADGERVGRNRIEKILDGCAILEHWTGAGGGTGKSLFYVDTGNRWHQVWITQRALAPGGTKEKQQLDGAPPGAMRFQGRITHSEAGSWLDRTTLIPLDGGRVRQHIEISRDGGATWTATFDAIYRPSNSP